MKLTILSMTLQRADGASVTYERSFVEGVPCGAQACTDDNNWTPAELTITDVAFQKATEVVEAL